MKALTIILTITIQLISSGCATHSDETAATVSLTTPIAEVVINSSPDEDQKDASVRKSVCSKTTSPEDLPICKALLGPAKIELVEMDYPIEYSFREINLNGKGPDEVIAWESSWSGTSGGQLFVLTKSGGKLRKVFETDMTWSPIILLPSKHNGWRDFAYHVRGGGVDPKFVIVRFNGKRFEDFSRTQDEQPEGEILIGKNWTQTYFGPLPVQ